MCEGSENERPGVHELHITFDILDHDGTVLWTVWDTWICGLGYTHPAFLTWSQDSQSLFFTQKVAAGGDPPLFMNDDKGIWRVDLADGQATEVSVPDGYAHTISPDERRIVYMSRNEPPELVIYEIATGSEQRVAFWDVLFSEPRSLAEAGRFLWDPGSESVFFAARNGQVGEDVEFAVARLDIASLTITALIRDEDRFIWPQRITDGRILMRDWSGLTWWIDAQTGEMTTTPQAFPSPDEVKQILFFNEGYLWLSDVTDHGNAIEQIKYSIAQVAWDPSETLITADAFARDVFQFSPDRSRFVASQESLSSLLFDFQEAKWAALPQAMTSPSWSPDSEQLAYVWRDPSAGDASSAQPAVYVYDVDQKSEKLLFSTEGLMQALWSPDGTRLAVSAFNQPEKGGGDVWLVDPSTGDEEKVGFCVSMVGTSASHLRWSTDGQRLAMAQYNNEGMAEYAVLLLEDGTIERFDLNDLPGDQAWLPDPTGEDLKVISHSGERLVQAIPPKRSGQEQWWAGPSELRIVDAGTKTTLHKWEIDGIVPIARWSLDDAWLVFSVLQVEDLPCEFPEFGPCDIRSSIWRLRADGTGDMEMIVEEGFLLEIVPFYESQ